ncbi:MAG: NDP-hexose 2,3-dehydratase family protein [Saprospiraceae bacterium]|nr:NDP-hexose 2,3-dehydratase family protein [Saprospiraceae bacterium]
MTQIVNTLEALDQKLANLLQSSNFELSRIDFDRQDQWIFKNGMMSHKSGGYFHVTCVKNLEASKEHLFFFQPQSALTGLLLHKENGIIYVLIQARIEPGNTGILQLGPTIQSTPANFLRMHGGKGTSYLNYFYSGQENVLAFNSSNHLDIGKLFFQKSKLLNYAVVDKFIETDHAYLWTPLSVLQEAATKDYYLNTDLRSLLGVFNWDSLMGIHTKIEFNPSNLMQYYIKHRMAVHCIHQFVPLEKSESIHMTKDSIYAKEDSNSEIVLYDVKTLHREVGQWIQPLWKGKEKGSVLLLCRNWDSPKDLDFLLTVKYERGVAGNYNICPTLLEYPNEDKDVVLFNSGAIKREFYQSDEGGRFIDHEYLFRVSEINEDIEIQENQFWVSIGELKTILSLHNMPSIQLRNICSVILDKLNPNTFE